MTVLGIVNLSFFMLVVSLLNVMSGPDTAYTVGRSISQGCVAGLLSSLGVSVGCCVHVLVVAFRLTALLTASTVALMVIEAVGTTYLIYLGGRTLLAPSECDDTTVEQAETPAAKCVCPLKLLFMQGFLTSVLNLKVMLFSLSFFPQFVDPLATRKALAFLALRAMFIVVSMIWNSLVVRVAASIARRMVGKPGIRHWPNRIVDTAFIDLGAWLAFTTR